MQLKEIYNELFLQNLAQQIPQFDVNINLADKSLKQRMRAISLQINRSLLDKNYAQKIALLKKAISQIYKDKNSNLALIIFPDFVEVFGLDDFDLSMEALEFFTPFCTSEFAVRQFIKLNEDKALAYFKKWAKSENHHVRRLASEGCRSRLPWGEALPSFKKNPAKILEILEILKFDKENYVQKSVANNLNDISKDNPQVVLQLLQRWQKEKVNDKIIKHALRTLLKKGDETALGLIGINKKNLTKDFNIQTFALQKKLIKISQNLIFDFILESQVSNQKLRLEYAIYFLKKNGSHSKKIFQLTTKNFAKGVFKFSKKHSFRDLTTRKHNVGKHMISLVVNGVEIEKLNFILL